MKKLKRTDSTQKRKKKILLNFKKAAKEKHIFASDIIQLKAASAKTYPSVKHVNPGDYYKLILTFSNGEIRMFDMKPHLGKGIFRELRDEKLFSTAHVSFDTVEWDNEADIDPEVLYAHSKKIRDKKYSASRFSTALVTEPARNFRKK